MRLWEMIAQRFRAPALMERMFARFDVGTRFDDPHRAAELLRGAAVRCMSCGKTKECSAWLDRAETAEPAEPPSFCRNIHLIQRLRHETETPH